MIINNISVSIVNENECDVSCVRSNDVSYEAMGQLIS